MEDRLTNGTQPDASNIQIHDQANSVAIEVAAVAADEDVMDTATDDAQNLVLANDSAEPAATTSLPHVPTDAANNNENTTHVTGPNVSTGVSHLSYATAWSSFLALTYTR